MRFVTTSKQLGLEVFRRPRSVGFVGGALAVLATIAFSIAPPVARAAILGGFDSTALLLARMLIATALIGATLAFSSPDKLRLPWRGLASALFVGSINGLAMIIFFLALTDIQASLASMIIVLSAPIVLTLLALRGEKLTQRHLVRLGLALIGVYLLIGPSGQIHWWGAGLALLSTFLFATQTALTQWMLVGYPVRSVVFYVTLSMTIFVIFWWSIQGAVWTAPSVGGWLAVLVLAVVSTYLARMTYFGAIHRIGSGQVALLGPLETLLTVTWSIIFLSERLAPVQVVGGIFVLASALLAVRRLGRTNLRWPRR